MPFSFTLTSDDRVRARDAELLNLGGEDVSLVGGDMSETSSNDIAVVTGISCARQSVRREMPSNPGAFARRPDWGGGLSALLFKGNTPAVRDRAMSRCKERMLANVRITKTHEVSILPEDEGFTVAIRADAVGGRLEDTFLVRPPGV